MISVLIPSLGGQFGRNNWGDIVRSILDMDISVDYEIIVCTPRKWPLNHPKVKVIKDPEDNVGSIRPVNLCLRESQGDYFITFPSDYRLHPNAFNIQSFIESEVFANRKYKITSTGWRCDPPKGSVTEIETGILGGEHIDKWLQDTTGIESLSSLDIRIMALPAGARSTVEDLLGGVIFNETFLHVAGDNFLSAYMVSKENSQQLPTFMPETPCSWEVATSSQNHLRGRDKIAYLELMRYYSQNPDMPYNHVHEIEEDLE